MTTGRMLSDELLSAEVGPRRSHPRDSSQLLLGLMTLSRLADLKQQDHPADDPFEGILSKTVLRMLVSALYYRDEASVAHAQRVALLAVGTANYLGWELRERRLLEVSALVHDIGKIGVPDHILFKPDKLSTEEAELMDLHRNIGVDVLQACRADHEVIDIVSQAHNHFNGATNGFRRIGSDVHQGARILAVVDAYDSLNTNQIYRPMMPHDEIIKTLMESAGSRYDGNVIRTLDRWIASEGLPYSHSPDMAPPLPVAGTTPPNSMVADAGLLCHIFSYLYFLESLYDGFYLADADLRFAVWNGGLERLLGYSALDRLGQVWTSRSIGYADQAGNPIPDGDCPMRKVIETGKPQTSTLRVQHADGNWIEVELQSVPLFDQSGHLHGVAEIFQDKSRHSRVPEFRELKMAASRDALTGVANRGELERQLKVLVAQFLQQKKPEPFSVIFLDIDFFKRINDTFGHAAGDQVLVDLSRLLQHELYSGELVARYGGEEFVILCPGTDLEQVHRRAERLRKAISETQIGNLQDHRVTASFGVAEMEHSDSAETLVSRADKALYCSKESGRNRTTALTSAALEEAENRVETHAEDDATPFLVRTTFEACLTADMIVYKLAGFVDDNRARLKEVTPTSVTMQVGKRGLLPFWGGRDERRPVSLELVFGDDRTPEANGSPRASTRATVTVSVRPLGRIRDRKVFEERANAVIKELRSYFVAN